MTKINQGKRRAREEGLGGYRAQRRPLSERNLVIKRGAVQTRGRVFLGLD